MSEPTTSDVLRGTLDLLVLKTLALGEETDSWRRYVAAVEQILQT